MVFGKKKPKISLEKVAEGVLELEVRVNNIASILQESCPAVKRYLDSIEMEGRVVQQPEQQKKKLKDTEDLIEGKPIKEAKQVLRL